MKAPFALFIGFFCLVMLRPVQAQGSLFVHVPLPDLDHIALSAIGGSTIELRQDNRISLTPPDMARLDQRRILGCKQDTLTSAQGPDMILTTCEVDTFFVSREVYVTNVPVEILTFANRTFKGKSTFGWEILRQLGETDGPILNRNSNPEISIKRPVVVATSDEDALIQAIEEEEEKIVATPPPPPPLPPATSPVYNPAQDPNLPFQAGDIEEIRLIKCNDLTTTTNRLAEVETFLNRYIVFCDRTSVDPGIPPSAAVGRVQYALTVRYFQPFDADRAKVLGEILAKELQVPTSQVFVEDMLPAYNGVPPRRDYLEIWFK